jgi:hypothetical protein
MFNRGVQQLAKMVSVCSNKFHSVSQMAFKIGSGAGLRATIQMFNTRMDIIVGVSNVLAICPRKIGFVFCCSAKMIRA